MRRRFTGLLQALPLRRKLSWLIAVCAGFTALLCMLAVVVSGLWLQRDSAREETDEVARTLAFALQAPLAFDDLQGVQEALATLRARPQVESAIVFDRDGRLLARYGQPATAEQDTANAGLFARRLQTSAQVRSEAGVVGRVQVVNRLSRLWQALGLAMAAIALASAAALVVSVLLAQRIARALTQPIDTLAEASRAIARHHDYTQRLPSGGADEIGTATQAFNEMLDEIGARGDALVAANSQLERRVAERTLSLQREKERAESASIAKTRFLANMSHELRTPLNAVIGAAQLLQHGRDETGGQAPLVNAIRDSGTRLLGLIDNVLDLARIETGAFELVAEDFDLVDSVESALATAAVAARPKWLALACIIEPGLVPWRRGDATRLRQVLLNLLGNAVKFTPSGEVVLRVGAGAAADSLRFSVSDTGIGIGAASQAQVFEPFRQADDASNRRYGGSGLGLAISRELVEAMGGHISLHSQLGHGSRFDFEVVMPAHATPLAAPAATLATHAVAFFEPHEASAQALAAQLERLACKGRRCTTALEARAWWEAHAPLHAGAASAWLLVAVDSPGSRAFLDAVHPHVDPARVVELLACEAPAHGGPWQRAGAVQPLLKPVLRAELAARLSAADAWQTAPAATPPPDRLATAARAAAKHVLVVEDDLTNQLIVSGMLHSGGYRTSTAKDGEEALAMLAQHVYDVVLMDWQMPDMDGLEVTRRLRAGAAGRFATVVPIIGLTANAFAEDRALCLGAGMNDFLTKPVLMTNLLDTVARWTARPGGDEQSARSSAFGTLG